MTLNNFPTALVLMKTLVFDPFKFKIQNLVTSVESSAYAACHFEINGSNIVFRSAKITPTKTGQFVTVWKRNAKGLTQPYELSDDFDCMVIHVESGMHSGQFILPKTALIKHGIITDGIQPGKRGIRVYPPWDETNNNQAQKTQKWQLDYFLDTSTTVNLEKIKRLFGW